MSNERTFTRSSTRELESFKTGSSSVNSLVGIRDNSNSVAADDYSFSPPGSSNQVYMSDKAVHPYTDYNQSEEIDFLSSSAWPETAPPSRATLFPAPGATTTAKAALSYTEELNSLPKKHVFAPPGKIGVAIDVVNGQPVVHKIRKGSPLENMLRQNDIIVAIDDEDTSCLSAADVTSMMVKRMDRVRKITVVRRP